MFSSVAKRALVNSVEELALNNTKPLNIIIIIIIIIELLEVASSFLAPQEP